MKLSALLLTLAIALGISAPLDAKTKKPKVQHHTTQKAPKVSHKTPKLKKHPSKVKPMKYRKAKHSAKAPKAHKVKRPTSV